MIEDYWTDGVVYFVSFKSELRKNKHFHRTLVIKREQEKEEIIELLKKTFSDSTITITAIEYYSDALVLNSIFEN